MCTALALACLVGAGWGVARITAAFVRPLWNAASLECEGLRCNVHTNVFALLPPERRPLAGSLPSARERLESHLEGPWVRPSLGLIELLRTGFPIVICLSLGLAFRHLAQPHVVHARAVAPLGAASLAALLLAPSDILARGFTGALLFPSITGVREIQLVVLGDRLVACILLAASLWVAARVVEIGGRTREDLAGFV